MAKAIAILGSGGHARVVAATARALGIQVAGYWDDDESTWGSYKDGIPVSGPIPFSDALGHSAVIGIGSNDQRKKVAEELDLDWATLVHPFSWVDPTAQIGPGTVVFAGAVVQAGAVIGSHVILNTKASVDHDCVVGDFVHMAVAHLGGGSELGEGGFLGIGSSVIQGVRVGNWTVVGAGAAVIRDVPDGVTVAGVPAKQLG